MSVYASDPWIHAFTLPLIFQSPGPERPPCTGTHATAPDVTRMDA
jgi:hypothetical protein